MLKTLVDAFMQEMGLAGHRPKAKTKSKPKEHLGRRSAGGFATDTGQVYTLDGIPEVGRIKCEHCGKFSEQAQQAADSAIKRAVTGSIRVHRTGGFEAEIVSGRDGRPLSTMLK